MKKSAIDYNYKFMSKSLTSLITKKETLTTEKYIFFSPYNIYFSFYTILCLVFFSPTLLSQTIVIIEHNVSRLKWVKGFGGSPILTGVIQDYIIPRRSDKS